MTWQFRCRSTCKIVTWLENSFLRMSNIGFFQALDNGFINHLWNGSFIKQAGTHQSHSASAIRNWTITLSRQFFIELLIVYAKWLPFSLALNILIYLQLSWFDVWPIFWLILFTGSLMQMVSGCNYVAGLYVWQLARYVIQKKLRYLQRRGHLRLWFADASWSLTGQTMLRVALTHGKKVSSGNEGVYINDSIYRYVSFI